MALFNSTSTTASSMPAGSSGGTFAAAMESIGSALGELRSGIEALPSSIEKAFVSAISSDAANESIYDAVASASYDAISDVQADHGTPNGMVSGMGPKGNLGDNKLPGRSFSLKELLATSPGDGDAGDRKRMRDLQQNFYANLAPEFYTKGAKVFDKILAGDLDVAAIADSMGAMGLTPGPDGDNGMDWLDMLDIASDLWPSRRRKGKKKKKKGKGKGKKGKGKNNKPNKKGGNDKNNKSDNKKNDPGKKGKSKDNKKGKDGSRDTKGKKRGTKQESPSKKSPPKKTPTGPKNQAAKAGRKAATEGTKTAAKTGAKTAAKTGAKVAAKTGGKVAARVAAKTALRAVPVVGQVIGAGMLAYDAYQIGSGIKELGNVRDEGKQNVANMNEANLGNFKKQQEGKVGAEERIAAYEATQASAKRLHEVQNSVGVLAFADDEKAGQAMQEYRDIMSGKLKMEGAKEGEPLDEEAVKKYVLDRIKGIGSGWTKDLAEAMIEDAVASDKYREVLENTSPNGQNKDKDKDGASGDEKQGTENGQSGVPGAAVVPMAAGAMENKTPDTVNAGTGVMTMDLLTASEQMQQFRQFTFEGVRDALLLPEVRDMFNNTAQTAGASVEKKLMG